MILRYVLLACVAVMGLQSVAALYDRSDNVLEVTDANFERIKSESEKSGIFLEFYAEWCGHCRALAPKWKNVATELKGKVRVGAVNCEKNQETCSKFGIQGFPTLKFLAGGRTIDYNGPREESDLVTFAMNEWTASRPPPEVHELTSSGVMEEHCMGNQLCFVALLPHILDSKADGRRKYLKMIKDLAKTFKDRPFAYGTSGLHHREHTTHLAHYSKFPSMCIQCGAKLALSLNLRLRCTLLLGRRPCLRWPPQRTNIRPSRAASRAKA